MLELQDNRYTQVPGGLTGHFTRHYRCVDSLFDNSEAVDAELFQPFLPHEELVLLVVYKVNGIRCAVLRNCLKI